MRVIQFYIQVIHRSASTHSIRFAHATSQQPLVNEFSIASKQLGCNLLSWEHVISNIDKAGAPFTQGIRFLNASSVPVVYADSSAFTTAGWTVVQVVDGVEVTPSYTVAPSPVAAIAATDSIFTVILPLGSGPVTFIPPTDFSIDFTNTIGLQAEANNRDDIVSLLLSTQGQPLSQGSSTSVRNFSVIEGDSFLSTQFTVPLVVFTNLGMLEADLDDPSIISYEGQVRLGSNAREEPNAYLEVCFQSVTAPDVFFTIGWGKYPEAVSGVQLGMSLGTTDADTQNESFLWDFDAEAVITIGTISAVNQGLKTFTFPSTCWARGQTFTVSGSTGNDGAYTTASFVYSGANVVATVVETIPSAVADGDVVQTKTITPANGSIAVARQETQR